MSLPRACIRLKMIDYEIQCSIVNKSFETVLLIFKTWVSISWSKKLFRISTKSLLIFAINGLIGISVSSTLINPSFS